MANNLFVNRLRVLTQDGQVAYDERFHHGVNIIRGDNSSGKSTITHLLFYGLGGEYTRFVEQARRCSRVLVEVSTGDATVTLERPLDKDTEGRVKPRQAMTLHWGDMDDTMGGRCRSQRMGYATTQEREGFSSVLFRLMGIPQVQADSRITMHQLLRLIYVDQESPSWSVFMHEQFDNQSTREAVADLLMGIFESGLYEARAHLRDLETRIADTKAALHAAHATLPAEAHSSKRVNGLIQDKKDEMEKLEHDIGRLRAGEQAESQSKPLVQQQKAEVAGLAVKCNQLEEEADLLEHEVADTQFFLDALRCKREALEQSASARRVLGRLRLDYCPECLSPLPDDVPEGTCRLCKSPMEEEAGLTQARRLAEEISLQIAESEADIKDEKEKLSQVKAELRTLRRKHKTAQQALDRLLGVARSTQAGALEDLCYKMGCAQGELTQYYSLLEQAEYYERLAGRMADMQDDYTHTREVIEAHMKGQEKRRDEVRHCMQRHAVELLHRDRASQQEFVHAHAEDFHVNFSDNRVFLGQPADRLSASSAFLLKLVARFSLFLASLDITRMRYPRFILADDMEDKGMETVRAQQFQQTLISRLSQYPEDSFQVIYTTSCITPQLDQSALVVGEHYRAGHKSLRNV